MIEHRAGRDPETLSSEYNIKNDNDEDETVMSKQVETRTDKAVMILNDGDNDNRVMSMPKPGLTKQ